MHTYQILLPQVSNSGQPYAAAIKEWLGEALSLAGGFTILTDDARGAWQNGDRTMLDNSSAIQVTTTPELWQTILAKVWHIFPDQVSFAWTDLGEGFVTLRPLTHGEEALRDRLRDRFDRSRGWPVDPKAPAPELRAPAAWAECIDCDLAPYTGHIQPDGRAER